MALGNAVTDLDADFEANFQAAWQKLERLCEEAVRENKCAEKGKRRDSEKGKVEKTERSLDMSTKERQEGSSKSDSSKKIKEKGISGSLNSSPKKRELKRPSMSFEECLNYDLPQKKKFKKAVKSSVSAGEEEQWHSAHLLCHPSVTSSCTSHPIPSRKRSNEQRAEQEPPEAPAPKRTLLNVDIKLPEIPLPPVQGSSSPLPAAESAACSQQKRRALYSAAEEPEGGFTGRRVYSRTPVFSGLKTSRVPRTPSLQSPPVTTPTGSVSNDSERLWQNRCLREFKNEEPKAAESWQEMYLRLHEAREQRLLKLAQRISSAEANKDRAAQTLFLDSPPKAPLDVRRRQKLGTGGALLPETKTKPVPCASTQSHPGVSQKTCDGASTSSAHSVPSSARAFSSDPRKPPVKKIAPLMAQSLKDLKKLFSRR